MGSSAIHEPASPLIRLYCRLLQNSCTVLTYPRATGSLLHKKKETSLDQTIRIKIKFMHDGTKLLQSDLHYNTKTTKVNGRSKFLSIFFFKIFFALGLKRLSNCVVIIFMVYLDFFKLFQQRLLFLLSFLPFSLMLRDYRVKKFVFLQEKYANIKTMLKTKIQESKCAVEVKVKSAYAPSGSSGRSLSQ